MIRRDNRNRNGQSKFEIQNVPLSSGGTDKSLSEALIFASTNPQYDNRLLIELQVQ